MNPEVLTGHLGTAIDVDICLPCQAFWFDSSREPAALASRRAQALPRHRRARAGDARRRRPARRPVRDAASACCSTHDQQRSTQFQYLRCPRGHGRLISFVDFLREKDFIRPLTPQQIDELRRERSDGQLLELRRADRPREGFVVRPLRLAAVDARHEAGRRAGRRARTTPSSRGRSIRRCRCAWRRRGVKSRRRSPRSSAGRDGSTTCRAAGWWRPASARWRAG